MTASIEELRKVLDYDTLTGVFHWSHGMRKRNAGAVAGTVNDDGYVCIKYQRKVYWGHRIAWAFVHGEWPHELIDHKDLNRSNNAIANLREANRSSNIWNSPKLKSNTSGRKGVSVTASGRYLAQIRAYRKNHYLGLFDSVEEAHAAYCAAADKLHGEYANHG